ncbi:hypothetical protein GJAV_G00019370 [Gymnothorax javanicus]|nr:hypothetical protein GJAV_G00019370 [Gymnothorax javanicus]
MSVDRYIAIVHSRKSSSIRVAKHALIGVVVIWILSFAMAAPIAYYKAIVRGDNGTYCWEVWPDLNQKKVYVVCTFVFGYVLPLLLISFCYAKVLNHLHKKLRNLSKKSEASKKKVCISIVTFVKGSLLNKGPSSRINWLLQMMSSEDELAGEAHPNEQERRARQHQTPTYLDDYILAYNPQRHALSSRPTERDPEEQRGAAAAEDGGQAGVASQMDRSIALHSPHSRDLLNTTSLRKLIESISQNAREENVEVAQLTNKLRQYENRQRRRQELLEHIALFLMEEEVNEDHHNRKGDSHPPTRASSALRPSTGLNSPQHSSTPVNQAHNIEPRACEYISECLSLRPEGETRARDCTPTARSKTGDSAFTPIHPTSSKCPSSPYSTISSGIVTPPLVQQQHIRPNPVQSQATGTPNSYDDCVLGLQPQGRQQLATNSSACSPVSVPRSYPAALHYPPPSVMPQAALNYGQYAAMPTVMAPQQHPSSAPVVGDSLPAVQPQLPPSQSVVPLSFGLPHRSGYGVLEPRIPDFTTDSEKAFANLKLALDNLLEPHLELTEKYKYHVLLEHLKLPEAQMIAQSYRHHPHPYSAAMQALQFQYGQPHQLA